MILSHKYKFIFLKTNKTAGTSIEIALSRHTGPADITTSISRREERFRRESGGRGPQNCFAPIQAYRFRDLRRLSLRRRRKLRFANHMPARRVRVRISREVRDDYYKFCFERNPWDRVISRYYWTYKSAPRPAISSYLASDRVMRLKRLGYGLYTIDGEIVVDRICYFENIADELESFRRLVGIPEPLELPHAKSRFRRDRRKHWEILDDAERRKVAELFQDEIRLMGYRFRPLRDA